MSLIEKIDAEIAMYQQRVNNRQGENYHDESERLLRFEERLHEAERIKEIILSEQKEPSWKQYIRQRQITIIDDHCVCGMAIDNGWEFCPKCGRQINARNYTVPRPTNRTRMVSKIKI